MNFSCRPNDVDVIIQIWGWMDSVVKCTKTAPALHYWNINGVPRTRGGKYFTVKLPGSNRITCVVGDTCLTVHDTQGHAYMFPKNDAQFPDCFAVEPVDVEPAKIYKPIDPRFLTLAYKYVGENAFWSPVDALACGEHSARVWCTSYGDGVERKAVVMPYRRN